MTAGLRVAVDATALLTPRTGIGVFTLELLRHLPATGVSPIAYATSWRGRKRLHREVPPRVEVSTRPQAARPLRELWKRFDAPPIEWWTGSVDVVHGPNYVAPPARRASSVVSVHDLTFHHFPQMCTAATLEYPRLIARAVARGAWIHTDSEYVAAEVTAELGVPAERVVTVPLGVSPASPGDTAEGRRMAGSDRFILALGTIEPRKDLTLLVDSFDALAAGDRELRLVLAGPDGWGAEELAERVARSPHAARVIRLGWVDDAQRAALLSAAAVLAYPSRYEGFGLPPLEAMAAGTPVVSTTAGSLPEVLGAAALLVPPGDADALGAALAGALDDEDLRSRLIDDGRRQAAGYSWERCAAGIAALYRRVAA